MAPIPPQWSGFIDLHCHIVPGMDDGPSDMDEAIALARRATSDGIGGVVATVHASRASYFPSNDAVGDAFIRLTAALKAAQLRLGLWLWREIDLLDACEASDAELVEMSLAGAGRWLLIEIPPTLLPQAAEEMIFQLQIRGLGIVLSHVDRIVGGNYDIDTLARLLERGVRLQVNAEAFIARDRARRRIMRALLDRGLVFAIASDSHGPTNRYYSLRNAHRLLTKAVGSAMADQLFKGNPLSILPDRG